ncbi:hypothetical protein FKP32DRAFT_59872 [Trametes sanguinea]|nr:hypothetical protein FKP32DRAFT_59872 [Trametes sanguinea]
MEAVKYMDNESISCKGYDTTHSLPRDIYACSGFFRFVPPPGDQLSARELAMLPRTLPIPYPVPTTTSPGLTGKRSRGQMSPESRSRAGALQIQCKLRTCWLVDPNSAKFGVGL